MWLRISAVSCECNSTAESTFDVNVSREWSRETIVNTAHCLRYVCIVSKCFTITLLHILHLTLVSLSFVTWAHTLERSLLPRRLIARKHTPHSNTHTTHMHMDITRRSSKRLPHHSVKENVKQQLLIRL